VLAAIRKSDYLARYGGEEFVLVLPATKFSKAIELAERLRQIIENLKINLDGRVITVTASFGVTTYKRGTDKDALLQKADEMLYEAKRQGRNRIKPDLKVFHRQPPLAIASDEPLRY
jgi:diguanylate cyclase (GGDEF)-like protein